MGIEGWRRKALDRDQWRLTKGWRAKWWWWHIKSACLSSCRSYPEWKSNLFCIVLHYLVWPVQVFNIFPPCIIKCMILARMLMNVKCVIICSKIQLLRHFIVQNTTGKNGFKNNKTWGLIFFTTFLQNFSHSKRNSARY
jgi:hypothetical protein